MTHIAVRSTTVVRGNKLMDAKFIDFGVGDLGETLVAITVRAETEHNSDIIGTMPEECKFKVVEIGSNSRALESSCNVTGWISVNTDLGQPSTKKLEAGTGDLPVYVAYVQLSMREDIVFQSAELMTLPPGSEFKVIEKALRTV